MQCGAHKKKAVNPEQTCLFFMIIRALLDIIVLVILRIIASHVSLRRFSRVIIVASRSFHAKIKFAIGSSSPLKEEVSFHMNYPEMNRHC